jgi:hypothetical protein
MADHDQGTTPSRRQLWHPTEMPFFVFMVVLNIDATHRTERSGVVRRLTPSVD